MLMLTAIVLGFASEIIRLLAGEEIKVASDLLQIMSVILIVSPFGGLYSNSFVTQQQSVYVTKSTFWTLLVNVIFVGTLVPLYGVYGLAVAMVIVQGFHFYLNNYYFNSLKGRALCVVS